MSNAAPDPGRATELFVRHRDLLFTVAYELLGSASDAEDVLQEAWLQWAGQDLDSIEHPRAFLVRITTRRALDRLRALSRRREEYVGPWLPEPLLTAPDVADDIVLAESVSTAMLLVLETLAPTERAVFVLREVFAVDYDEIAAAVDKTPEAVRQIASRARKHVAERQPREAVSAAQVGAVLERFRRAAADGDIQGLLDVLAPDVVLVSDGGGVKQAALRPILGAEKVLRFLAGIREKGERQGLGEIGMDTLLLNGAPALRIFLGGQLEGVLTVLIEDGVAAGLYYVSNPDKLASLSAPRPLAR